MRGKVGWSFAGQGSRGITPAYAGKSYKTSNKEYCEKDHPRVCGEKNYRVKVALVNNGSPPRMRGKEVERIGLKYILRITPAYAGKSL